MPRDNPPLAAADEYREPIACDPHKQWTEATLRRAFLVAAAEMKVAPTARAMYYKANHLRELWTELHERGLPPPKFPDEG